MDKRRFGIRLGVLGLAVFAAMLSTTVAASAFDQNQPLTIDFIKQCPASTCTGVLVRDDGRAIPNSSDYWAPASVSLRAWPLVHFTAFENIAAAQGSLTIQSTGTIDCAAAPTTVAATGTVVSGSWEGHDLSGATIEEAGQRVSDESCGHPLTTTFAGTLMVFASR